MREASAPEYEESSAAEMGRKRGTVKCLFLETISMFSRFQCYLVGLFRTAYACRIFRSKIYRNRKILQAYAVNTYSKAI